MANRSITANDRRKQTSSLITEQNFGTTQTIAITDIVSEGEIKGLVNGGESILLNEDPLFTNDETEFRSVSLLGTAAINSTTVALTESTEQSIAEGTTRFLIIEDALEANVTLSAGAAINFHEPGNGWAKGQGVSWTLTASSAIFNTAFEHAPTGVASLRFSVANVVSGDGFFTLTTKSKGKVRGFITNINAAGTTCKFQTLDAGYDEFSGEEGVSIPHRLTMELYLQIASISGAQITLAANPPLAFTRKPIGITKSISTTGKSIEAKYPGSRYQFSPGTQTQTPLQSLNGQGSSSSAMTVVNGTLFRGGNAATMTGTSSLGGGQAAEVDQVNIIMQYPNGLFSTGGDNGSIYPSGAAYRIEVGVQRGTSASSAYVYERLKGNIGPDVYSTSGNDIGSGNITGTSISNSGEFVYGHGAPGIKGDSCSRPIGFEISINMEPYQPFSNFQIRITRLTNHGTVIGGVDYTAPVNWRGAAGKKFRSPPNADYNITGAATISSATAIIKEKLNYPFTSMVSTSVSTKQFQSVPKRQYELYGIMVQVPSNYVTREENTTETTHPTLVASYKRNPSTGLVTATNQPWDGNFRGEKIYTNNPAWVFYDVLTNNRYGLGKYLKSTSIDKYALYKIAKYCDELVPDGKGGMEPRFTANLYLQKATDAYKVLKDMATIFRGMIYWVDGKVQAVIDEKKEPVYNFSKANVIDGKIGYQSTGSKTRANQYIVTWNNPVTGYKLEPVIVEDKQNIAETGTIISQTAVAFGCTSEGQAIRYGRWKLWTAVNQTEIVAFTTAENGAFLAPGDIINVQDADEYDIPFSGRVHLYNESGGPKVTLDRDIDPYLISTDHSYTIAIVVPKKIAILNQNSATIGSSTYSRGETVAQARLTHGGSQSTLVVTDNDTTELNVENALDDSNEPLHLVLRDSTIVQERALTGSTTVDSIAYTIGNSAVEGRTTVTLDSALDDDSVSDVKESLWVIKQTNTAQNRITASSPKQYKILSISNDEDGKYTITGVEHYNTKFDAIERDFNLAVEDAIYPPEPTSTPPAPTSLRILRIPDRTLPGEEVLVEWDAPSYGYIKEYEVTHQFNKARDDAKLVVPAGETQTAFGGIEDGFYSISVRTVSQYNKKSKSITSSVELTDIFSNNVPRINGLPKGCISTSALQVGLNNSNEKTGLVFFANGSYSVAPLSALEDDGYINVLKQNDQTNVNSTKQLITEIAESDWAGQSTAVGKFAYLFYDYSETSGSSTDPIRLITWKVDPTLGVSYWYDADKYATNVDDIWTNIAGTVSVTGNKVTGSGTSFSSLKLTNIVKFSSTFASSIAYIESDTVMYIAAIPPTNLVGLTAKRDELNPDYTADFLLGDVSYINNLYNLSSYVQVKRDQIDSRRAILCTSNITSLSYDFDQAMQTSYTDITLSIDALNYNNPEIKVTGTGYNSTTASLVPETAFTAVSSREVVVHSSAASIAYNSGAQLDFIIEIREKDNPSRTRTKTFTINKTIDEAGASGFSVSASNTDHRFVMNSAGEVGANDFSSDISVFKSGTEYTYASSGTAANTYGVVAQNPIGGMVGVLNSEILISSISNQARVTLYSTANILDTPAVQSGKFKIKVTDLANSGQTIGTFVYTLSKIPLTTRDGSTVTLSMTAAQAASWKGTLTDAVAQAVITAFLGSNLIQPDGTSLVKRIVPNDRITVKSGTVVATRIYTGAATSIAGTPGAGSFSSPVTAEFDGSVIVDGTLSAASIAANTILGNQIKAGSIIQLGTSSNDANAQLHSFQKTSLNDTDPGFFMNGAGHFSVGSSTGGSMVFDGTSFSFTGSSRATKTVQIWKLSSVTSASGSVPSVNASVVYATGAVSFVSGSTGNSNGWYTTKQATTAALPYLHERAVIIDAPNSGNVSVIPSQWLDMGVVSVLGEEGPAGINTATVSLYRVSTSGSTAPAFFSGTFTYTFATGTLTGGTPNGWTTATPAVPQGSYLWVRQAPARSIATSIQINHTTFSSAIVVSASGANGNGPAGTAFYVITGGAGTPASTDITGTKVFNEIGRYAVEGDLIVVKNTATPVVSKGFKCTAPQTVAASGHTGTFGVAALFVTGDLIVDGSIGATKILAGSIGADRLQIGTSGRSGARIVLTDQKMEVYSTTTTKRVILGNLS